MGEQCRRSNGTKADSPDLVDRSALDRADGACKRSGDHDYRSRDCLPGEWAAGFRDAACELAGIYLGEWASNCCRQCRRYGWRGWVSKCEPGAKPGSDAGRPILHGGFLYERRLSEHAVFRILDGVVY